MRLFTEDQLESGTVEGVEQALADTRHAFDNVAETYDRSNAENPMLVEMRRHALAAVEAFVPTGSHVLDLGCGPGCDDLDLARRGYRVTAVDWSPAMVEVAQRRMRNAGLDGSVDVRRLGIHELDRLAPATFDAALSNFGPLNCLPDPHQAARLIASRLRVGSMFVASVMGRVCPWEIALYLGRGAWSRAAVRFTRRLVPVPLNGRTVWTRYYSPGEFGRTFAAAGFERVCLRTLGLVVPPPYLHAFARRHPALLEALQRLESLIGDWPGVRAWGDHFLIVLRRV